MKCRGNNWQLAAGLKAVFAALLSVNSASYAQDVVPQTPPELRDFKLDPEKPKPEPKPLPQDTPQAPPANDTPRQPQVVRPQPAVTGTVVRPTPRPVIIVPDVTPIAPTRSAPAPIKERSATSTSAPPTPQSPAVAAPPPQTAGPPQDGGGPTPAATFTTEPQTNPSAAAPNGQAPTAETSDVSANSSSPFPYWWIMIAAAAIAGAIVLFLRRRKAVAYEPETVPEQSEYAASESIDTPAALAAIETETITPPPFSIPVPVAAKPKRREKRPNLEISFIPEKATLSLAKLTIKGQIRIINNGNAEAKSIQLRAAIISASVHQEQDIELFHSHLQTPGDEIGTATIGERIAMDIDLIIPLTELSSFAIGDKQLFAPIVVAHVDYAWGNGTAPKRDIAKISCLIGREATPPKPKMAPLRLDLGPRSFTPLGQRPVFA